MNTKDYPMGLKGWLGILIGFLAVILLFPLLPFILLAVWIRGLVKGEAVTSE